MGDDVVGFGARWGWSVRGWVYGVWMQARGGHRFAAGRIEWEGVIHCV